MIQPIHKQMINNKILAVKTQEEEKKRAEEQRLHNARDQCIRLQRRCENIIDTANMILYSGLDLPKRAVLENYGYKYDALAEGFYHGVGFMGRGLTKPITHVGVYAGGACGHWDFYIDGTRFFLMHDQSFVTKNPSAAQMERFAEEFPLFESAFYKWIEDGMK